MNDQPEFHLPTNMKSKTKIEVALVLLNLLLLSGLSLLIMSGCEKEADYDGYPPMSDEPNTRE